MRIGKMQRPSRNCWICKVVFLSLFTFFHVEVFFSIILNNFTKPPVHKNMLKHANVQNWVIIRWHSLGAKLLNHFTYLLHGLCYSVDSLRVKFLIQLWALPLLRSCTARLTSDLRAYIKPCRLCQISFHGVSSEDDVWKTRI